MDGDQERAQGVSFCSLGFFFGEVIHQKNRQFSLYLCDDDVLFNCVSCVSTCVKTCKEDIWFASFEIK